MGIPTGVDSEARKFIKEMLFKHVGWYPTGTNDNEGFALYGIAKKCRRGTIVEIGTWMGGSALILAAGSKAGNKMPIYSIDPHSGINGTPDQSCTSKGAELYDLNVPGTPDRKYYVGQGKTFEAFWNKVKLFGMEDIINPIVDYSELAREKYDGPKIEFLFIDGDHRYNYAKMDFDLWEPLLLKGGILMMHDICWPGPIRVMQEDVLGSGRFEDIREEVRSEYMDNYEGPVCLYALKRKDKE